MNQHDQYKERLHEFVAGDRFEYEGVAKQFVDLARALCYLAADLPPGERHKAFDYLLEIAEYDPCDKKREAILRVLSYWRRAWLDSQFEKLYQRVKKAQKDNPSFADFPEIQGVTEMYHLHLEWERERRDQDELDPIGYGYD